MIAIVQKSFFFFYICLYVCEAIMNKGVKSMLCKISVLSAIDSLLILFSHEIL